MSADHDIVVTRTRLEIYMTVKMRYAYVRLLFSTSDTIVIVTSVFKTRFLNTLQNNNMMNKFITDSANRKKIKVTTSANCSIRPIKSIVHIWFV